jgi:hypothetical protein
MDISIIDLSDFIHSGFCPHKPIQSHRLGPDFSADVSFDRDHVFLWSDRKIVVFDTPALFLSFHRLHGFSRQACQ